MGRIIWIVTRVCLIVLLSVLVVLGWKYIQSRRVPEEYQPVELSAHQRKAEAENFIRQSLDFSNKAQLPKPFVWTITQERLNAYLASMDEIAADLPGREMTEGQITTMLSEAGLSQPTAVFGDGVIILMAWSKAHKTVVSADLALAAPSAGELQIKLVGARIGRMRLPKAVTDNALTFVKAMVRDRANKRRSTSRRSNGPGLSGDEITELLETLINSINAEPFRSDCKIDGKAIRIVGIETSPGALSLQVEPLGRKTLPKGESFDPFDKDYLPELIVNP